MLKISEKSVQPFGRDDVTNKQTNKQINKQTDKRIYNINRIEGFAFEKIILDRGFCFRKNYCL